MSELRRKVLAESKRIVVKVGSRILVDPGGGIRKEWIAAFTASIARLISDGREVVVVTSGAVGAGMAALGYATKPDQMAEKQACAAVGQIDLMHIYRQCFAKVGLMAGQMLLSADDFRDRTRYRNLQNTVKALLRKKVIPIINENDSVAVAEIKVGDNDKLSADVTMFLDADLLLVFTDEDGLFDANPKTNRHARLLEMVPEINPEVLALAGKPGETGSVVSTGGMYSKLTAIREVTRSGCNAFLANGNGVLPHQVLLENARGTCFLAHPRKLTSRKRWLSFISSPRGFVVVDAGGARALREKNSSLLPVGIVEVRGRFDQGDLLEVRDGETNKLARGITQYDSETLRRIIGRKSKEIFSILGPQSSEEVIHKNDMVLL